MDGVSVGKAEDGEHLVFEDHFDTPALDRSKWSPHYLPHWTTVDSAASYEIRDSVLRLSIAPDQPPWCPEFDGPIRVSNLQTGHWSGPLGSTQGQHRFRPDLHVRRALPTEQLFLHHYGRLDMRARASLKPWNLAALWLIGFEDEPARSGEITLFEVFGNRAQPGACIVNRGIKRINDPTLSDEIDSRPLPLAVEDWHVYGLDWTPSGIRFLVDGQEVTRTHQSPAYPMQLMLNLYDLSGDTRESEQGWFEIDVIRAWRLGG